MTDPDASPIRRAILAAFSELVFERRYETIRVTEIAARAQVGRATFYEHFRGKADVLVTAMDPVLTALALAAAGRPARSYVTGMVAHLWERRSVGRAILNSTAANLVQRRLAAMIAQAGKTSALPTLAASGAAAAQIAMLRSWLAGEVSCGAGDVAEMMLACAAFAGQPARAK